MYREMAAYQLRCARGHAHSDAGAEGAYCLIAPCREWEGWSAPRLIRRHYDSCRPPRAVDSAPSDRANNSTAS